MKNVLYTILIMLGVILMSFQFLSCDHSQYSISLWEVTPACEFAKAIEKNDTILANEIIKRDKLDIDCREPKYGASLLFWAIEHHNTEMAEYLLKKGADPNLHDTWTGNSPILLSTVHAANNREILKLLLLYGGNPNEYVKADEPIRYEARELGTPLTFATNFQLETVKMLVQAGGDVNFSPDSEPGHTALLGSISRTSSDILKYLLIDCKADYTKCYVLTIQGDSIGFFELIDEWIDRYPSEDNDTKVVLQYIDKEKKVWEEKLSDERSR